MIKRSAFRRPGRLARGLRFHGVTALVLVAVLALNLLFSALSAAGLWFLDLTTYTRQGQHGTETYELYTLTDGVLTFFDGSVLSV